MCVYMHTSTKRMNEFQAKIIMHKYVKRDRENESEEDPKRQQAQRRCCR